MAEVKTEKKARKPRDPNAPRKARPLYIAFRLDETAKGGVSFVKVSRNPKDVLDAMEQGASYTKIEAE